VKIFPSQLCPTRGPVYVSAAVKAILHEAAILHADNQCFYFDNLEFDIFDAGSSQSQFITSVTVAFRIRTL